MKWETFYDLFYEWSASTQRRRISDLETFGPSSEVCEIAESFLEERDGIAFLRKALSCGVRFSPQEIREQLMYALPAEDHPALLRANSRPYTEEDIDCFYGYIEDGLLEQIVRENRIPYDFTFGLHDDAEENPGRPSGGGFFARLLLAIGIGGAARRKHSGHCDGDCAHCPPHYGYRYGRWYYGHGHQYGCEFGGNRGGGGMD